MFSKKANEIELNWLIENCFTLAQKKQLEQIKSSTQTNLFSKKEIEIETKLDIIEYNFNDIKADIDALMQRLGWSIDWGKQYLIDIYNKKSRL